MIVEGDELPTQINDNNAAADILDRFVLNKRPDVPKINSEECRYF
jgi:hypothetical protein